jgi:hypothetical protein
MMGVTEANWRDALKSPQAVAYGLLAVPKRHASSAVPSPHSPPTRR